MVIFFPSCHGLEKMLDRKMGRLAVQGLSFRQANERQGKERGNWAKGGIQIKLDLDYGENGRSQMPVDTCMKRWGGRK